MHGYYKYEACFNFSHYIYFHITFMYTQPHSTIESTTYYYYIQDDGFKNGRKFPNLMCAHKRRSKHCYTLKYNEQFSVYDITVY